MNTDGRARLNPRQARTKYGEYLCLSVFICGSLFFMRERCRLCGLAYSRASIYHFSLPQE